MMLAAIASVALSSEALADVQITPTEVTFTRNFDQAQLLVAVTDASGRIHERSEDLTNRATYQSSNPEVVTVSPSGRLTAVGNGSAQVVVSVDGVSKEASVH